MYIAHEYIIILLVLYAIIVPVYTLSFFHGSCPSQPLRPSRHGALVWLCRDTKVKSLACTRPLYGHSAGEHPLLALTGLTARPLTSHMQSSIFNLFTTYCLVVLIYSAL
jgi:hypothetical protein